MLKALIDVSGLGVEDLLLVHGVGDDQGVVPDDVTAGEHTLGVVIGHLRNENKYLTIALWDKK